MITKRIIVGNLDTNCYILEINNICIIIDPGSEFATIKKNITKKVVGILITHHHFDHVGALNDCVSYYNTFVYDKSNLKEGYNNINSFEFEVIYNPGHTLDSISFKFNDIIFSGDFIFEGCIGRCDLGGDFALMKRSIEKILKYSNDYIIYPGHGNFTSLNKERKMLESYIK